MAENSAAQALHPKDVEQRVWNFVVLIQGTGPSTCRNKLDQVVGLFGCWFLDGRAAVAPTLKSDAAVHLAHDPVLLPHQHLPEDIERLFPEAIADPPRRGEEDLDPVDELQDPVPTLQAKRGLPFDCAGQDPKPATGTKKSRRKRLLPEPARNDINSICFVGGCEGGLPPDCGRLSRTR